MADSQQTSIVHKLPSDLKLGNKETDYLNYQRNSNSQSNLKIKSEQSIAAQTGKAVTFKDNTGLNQEQRNFLVVDLIREQNNKSAGPSISRESAIFYEVPLIPQNQTTLQTKYTLISNQAEQRPLQINNCSFNNATGTVQNKAIKIQLQNKIETNNDSFGTQSEFVQANLLKTSIKATPPQIPSLKLQQAQVMQMCQVEGEDQGHSQKQTKQNKMITNNNSPMPQTANSAALPQDKIFQRTPQNWYANSQAAGSLRTVGAPTTPTIKQMNSEMTNERSPSMKVKKLNTQIVQQMQRNGAISIKNLGQNWLHSTDMMALINYQSTGNSLITPISIGNLPSGSTGNIYFDSQIGRQTTGNNDYVRQNTVFNNINDMDFQISDANRVYKRQINQLNFQQWYQNMKNASVKPK